MIAATPPTNQTPKPPTHAQIRKAVKAATHSKLLWATVNICDTQRHPNAIGIRGQMPALGFPAQLQMTVHLSYWSQADSRYRALPNASRKISVGRITYGTVQDGALFKFTQPVTLKGSITFRWIYKRKLLATVTKPTTGHDKQVDLSDPPGASAATCKILTPPASRTAADRW